MIQLDLTAEERETLIDALNNQIGDLGMEISDTDRHDFRQELKKRKETLRKIVQALS